MMTWNENWDIEIVTPFQFIAMLVSSLKFHPIFYMISIPIII